MKEFFKGITITLALIIVTVTFSFTISKLLYTNTQEYTMTSVVTTPNELVDERGEAWAFSDIPFKAGTKVKVTFDRQDTDDITDDVIVAIEIN